MKRKFLYLIGIGLLNLILFTLVFRLLQSERVYHNTLGTISKNYERTGDWNNFEVKNISKPFVEIKNENFETWDAAIYKCISERMYSPEQAGYGNVRAAFFPLFPILWKITHCSPIGISLLNYLIFTISIAMLIIVLLKTTFVNQMIAYAVLITLPSTISYYIPYSESLFLFTMTLATIGLIKKKYWVFFIGCFLLAMVRPATAFVFIAILFTELLIFISQRQFRLFLKEIITKSLPFILGYFCTFFIQYLYSGSWTAFFDARKHWNPTVSFSSFSDWSVEGFGLSVFAIFFLCIPAIGFLLSLFLHKWKSNISEFFGKLKNYNHEYLFLVSIVYSIGIFLFSLINQGLDFHSFSRYILSSPPFYIALIILLNNLKNRPIKRFGIIYLGLTIAVITFLSIVKYGGDKIQFPFLGLYLFILAGLYIIIKRMIPKSVQIPIAFVLIFMNTVWNTYLLNSFLSNAWIFT